MRMLRHLLALLAALCAVPAVARPTTVNQTFTSSFSATNGKFARRLSFSGFIQPYNNDAVFLGDSRTFQGGTYNGTLGSGTGVTQTTSATTADGWIADLSANRIRPYANDNYGITGETIEQIATIPRAVATKGLDYVAASPASMVVLLAGTNDGPTPLGSSGAGRTAFQTIINCLTITTYSCPGYGGPLPLYNGQPKTLIIMNEWPRGIDKTGATQNVYTTPAALEAFATWVSGFDAFSNSGYQNPHILVADTYHASSILNAGSGTNYYNITGLLYDGLHPMPPMGKAVAQVIASRISTVIPAPTSLALPTSGTTASYLNPNPMLTGTTGTAANITLHSGTLPSNTSVAGGTGLLLDVTYETAPSGATAMVLHISGTLASASNITVLQTHSGASGVTYGTDTLMATAEVAVSAVSGTKFKGASLDLYALTSGNTYNYTITDQVGQAITGPNSRYFNETLDASFGYMQRWTQPLSTAGMGPATVSSLNTRFTFGCDAGTIDFTVKIAQWGIGKI